MNTRLYSRFGRALAVVVTVLMTFAVVVVAFSEGLVAAVSALPFAAVVGWSSLLLFWFPELEIGEAGVRVRNVWSEYIVAWGAIQRIDTKYALTLVTQNRTITVWSAPAPGRHSVFNANREQGRHLPESTYLAGTIRPGDLPQSESGSAAAIIRREWERRRDQGLTSQNTHVSQRFRAELAAVTAVVTLLLTASLAL
jgi:hypothetical protein